ncbi:MAG: hypothetical protein KGH75_00590 [Rhodospirillales bacterium]|nr:hypothetical protein [Rhodospirillales bacterium]
MAETTATITGDIDISIIPATRASWPLRLKTLTPLAHGDPDAQDKSNTAPFRRIAQIVTFEEAGTPCTEAQLQRILQAVPAPTVLMEILEGMDAPEYLACAGLRLFLDAYNGTGMLDGPSRYDRLASRVWMSASRARSMRAFWSDLCKSLQTGGDGGFTPELLSYLAMPGTLSMHVLDIMVQQTETCVMVARAWNDAVKLSDRGYAERTGKAYQSTGYEIPMYSADRLPAPQLTAVRRIPAITGNAMRHSVLREPLMAHLKHHLDIPFFPEPVAKMLGNGGSIAGAQPYDEAALGAEIAQRYPSLALLGGSTGWIMLPRSYAQIPTWLVCHEHSAVLARYGITPEHAAEDLITTVTEVRHGADPMPVAGEVLVEGAEILSLLTIRLGAPDLVVGAAAAALLWYKQHAVAGGTAARGRGLLDLALPDDPEIAELAQGYEAYLRRNQDVLRAGLLDLTLGTGRNVCEAPKEKAKKGKGKGDED